MSEVETMRAAAPEEATGEADGVTLCSLHCGAQVYGIDTKKIREVLGGRVAERVPLAPEFIGGVVAYRGEVLTAVSLRALLGMPVCTATSCILVLEDEETEEHFGLMVDSVGGVVTVPQAQLEENPSTLDSRSTAIFDGTYKTPRGLIVQLDTKRLRPAWIQANGNGGGRA